MLSGRSFQSSQEHMMCSLLSLPEPDSGSPLWLDCRRFTAVQGNVVFFLIVTNPGLLIVDHIHFQYNGLLLGEIPCLPNSKTHLQRHAVKT